MYRSVYEPAQVSRVVKLTRCADRPRGSRLSASEWWGTERALTLMGIVDDVDGDQQTDVQSADEDDGPPTVGRRQPARKAPVA